MLYRPKHNRAKFKMTSPHFRPKRKKGTVKPIQIFTKPKPPKAVS